MNTSLVYENVYVTDNDEWKEKLSRPRLNVDVFDAFLKSPDSDFHFHSIGQDGKPTFLSSRCIIFEPVHDTQICLCCEAQKYNKSLKDILQIYEDAKFSREYTVPAFIDVWNDRKKEVSEFWAQGLDAWGVTLKPARKNFSEK
jgi:hypothetical protein